ncbi:MAG: archaeosortase/exosortase family protein [Candidatus Melainabacteria bacterium]|nr:archaeosortase/exosortase family protein [Candidatus Melainabacteria bacterium]
MKKRWYFYLQLLALWPAWSWFACRALDCSDEPLGLLALVTLVALVVVEVRSSTKQEARLESKSLLVPLVCLLLYGLATFVFPKSVQLLLALVAQLSLAQAIFFPNRLPSYLWGLLLLSVPSVATLNFYFGFPLRSFVAASSALLLNVSGYGAKSNGVQLFFVGREVIIDSACSGIHMLWISFYLAMLVAYLRRLNWSQTLALACAAGVFALFGNVLRAVSITMYESSVVLKPALEIYAHDAIGTACFLMVALAILVIAEKVPAGKLAQKAGSVYLRPAKHRLVYSLIGLNLLLILSSLLGSFDRTTVSDRTVVVDRTSSIDHQESHANTGDLQMLMSRFGLTNLSVVPLSSDEKVFARHFPGSVAKFEAGAKSVLVRTVNCETRQLHSSSDCYRGLGFKIKSLPILELDGIRWSRFEATRVKQRLQVSECIYDQAGGMWTDPSSWYWSALLGKTKGPWSFVTVATPIEQRS